MAKLGVTINGKHTLNDWGLHWSTCEIGEPVPITSYVTIPGRKTKLDVTESIRGSVAYENRKLVFGFWRKTTWEQWMLLSSRIQNAIDGKRCKIVLDTEPNAYWMGRVTVSSSMSPDSPVLCNFTISVDAEPFKYYIQKPADDYLWDDVKFDTDILQNLQNVSIPASTATAVSVTAGDRPLTPTVTTTQAMQVTAKGKIYSTTANEPLELPIVLYRETVSFSVTSTVAGTISITFRGESL